MSEKPKPTLEDLKLLYSRFLEAFNRADDATQMEYLEWDEEMGLAAGSLRQKGNPENN